MEENQDQVNKGSPAETSTENERTFSRDEMAKIVAAQTARVKRESDEHYQREMEKLNAQQAAKPPAAAPENPSIDTDAIYQKVQEKFNQEMLQRQQKMEDEKLNNHLANVATQYDTKISQGKSAYPDFDEVTKNFNPAEYPQVTYLLAHADEPAGALYEMLKSPSKLATLDHLARKSPHLAESELKKLSQSISANKQALDDAGNSQTSDPLDRLQPSRVSGSNGKMTTSDLRNQPWLKG